MDDLHRSCAHMLVKHVLGLADHNEQQLVEALRFRTKNRLAMRSAISEVT